MDKLRCYIIPIFAVMCVIVGWEVIFLAPLLDQILLVPVLWGFGYFCMLLLSWIVNEEEKFYG